MCFLLPKGQYIYFETSNPTRPKDRAALASPDLGVRRGCLSFYYHMFGERIGSLKVARINAAGRRLLWARHIDQGDRWLHAQVDIKEDSLYNVRSLCVCLITRKRNEGYTLAISCMRPDAEVVHLI